MKKRPSLSAEMDKLFPEKEGERDVAGGLKMVERKHIHTGEQPRRSFPAAELTQLAESIRDLHSQKRGVAGSGLLQPLLVRPAPDGNGYLLVAGERRLRASALAGIERLPVVITTDTDDESAVLLLQLVENMQRQDLAPLEEAQGIQTLMEGQSLSVREVARLLGKDKGYVQNRLFLLKAGHDVQKMVERRADTLRHARLIDGIQDQEKRTELIKMVLDHHSSLAELERHLHSSDKPPNISAEASDERLDSPKNPDDAPLGSDGHGQDTTDNPIRCLNARPDPLIEAVRPASTFLAEAVRQLDTMEITAVYRTKLRRELSTLRTRLAALEEKVG